MNLIYLLEYLQDVDEKRLAVIEILEEKIKELKDKYEDTTEG